MSDDALDELEVLQSIYLPETFHVTDTTKDNFKVGLPVTYGLRISDTAEQQDVGSVENTKWVEVWISIPAKYPEEYAGFSWRVENECDPTEDSSNSSHSSSVDDGSGLLSNEELAECRKKGDIEEHIRNIHKRKPPSITSKGASHRGIPKETLRGEPRGNPNKICTPIKAIHQ